MAERNGKRKTREQLSKCRTPELGYYTILTDTKETEKNYMEGLRDSIPKELQGRLVIKVRKKETAGLVEEARNIASLQAQYGERWIVFDRDQVTDFDQIISQAEQNDIHVGWSNPCIEIWFCAYFSAMPTCLDSVSCCDIFKQKYFNETGQEYKKSDPAIYAKLCRFGNEEQAIKIAEQKYREHQRNCKNQPSEMYPCTTLYTLIKEIKNKIEIR